MNALEVSPLDGIALYKSTFTYLLTYLLTNDHKKVKQCADDLRLTSNVAEKVSFLVLIHCNSGSH